MQTEIAFHSYFAQALAWEEFEWKDYAIYIVFPKFS